MAPYYYAGGRKVELGLDTEHAAVPFAEAKRLGVALPKNQRELSGGIALIRLDALSAPRLESLRRAGALRRVYNYGGTLIVPLPEVRVELEAGQREVVLSTIANASVPAKVDESTPGQLLVRPTSNLGDDALTLANEITEKANPALSAARMVQVVPRPDVNVRRKR
jgi:hypothetical protein